MHLNMKKLKKKRQNRKICSMSKEALNRVFTSCKQFRFKRKISY